jgi:hypothetical protein
MKRRQKMQKRFLSIRIADIFKISTIITTADITQAATISKEDK